MLPVDIATTGWPAVRDRTRTMGLRFDQWQADLVRGALAKRESGKYAATVGGIVWSLPRQVGKTFTVGSLLFALAVDNPGLLILWTAHHRQTAKETFGSMQSMARRKQIRPYVAHVYQGAGDESVVFKNGSRILFGSRDRGFGLGFAAVDVIVFDEAQRLSDQTRMDMVPATNRPHNPCGALLFYIGTPPRPNDNGEAFGTLRAEALSGESTDMFFVEMSADADADPDDREQWRKANPSYPHHTPEESMLRMRKHLGSDEAWLRDALGIWDAVGASGVIPVRAWEDATDEASKPVDGLALGVEVAPDLTHASVALAGVRSDGDRHIELDQDQHSMGKGTAWVIPYIERTVLDNPNVRAVVVDVAGPVKALLNERKGKRGSRWVFKGTAIEATPVKVAELGVGCAEVLDGVVNKTLHHIGQPQLDNAVQVAGKRPLGDTGMWVFSRKTATSDITPIQAATLALIGSSMSKPSRPNRDWSNGTRDWTNGEPSGGWVA